MSAYQRIFGTGPRGLAVSAALLAAAALVEGRAGLPPIHGSAVVGRVAFAVASLITAALVAWSFRSLPPAARGRSLITHGAFRFVRHPLYAAFLGCFDLGVAAYLDNWIYAAWAVLLYPVWHLNTIGEERMMHRAFPGEYEAYRARTGRFLPRLRGRRQQ